MEIEKIGLHFNNIFEPNPLVNELKVESEDKKVNIKYNANICVNFDSENFLKVVSTHDTTLLFTLESIKILLHKLAVLAINKNSNIEYGDIYVNYEHNVSLGEKDKRKIYSREILIIPYKLFN